MIGHYINKLVQGDFTYYDLHFVENDVLLLGLSGVIFNNAPDFTEMESRAIEIASYNLPSYTLTEIIVDN